MIVRAGFDSSFAGPISRPWRSPKCISEENPKAAHQTVSPLLLRKSNEEKDCVFKVPRW
jgi:hypothetical protein